MDADAPWRRSWFQGGIEQSRPLLLRVYSCAGFCLPPRGGAACNLSLTARSGRPTPAACDKHLGCVLQLDHLPGGWT
jgi:hypothetical protein